MVLPLLLCDFFLVESFKIFHEIHDSLESRGQLKKV